MLNQPSKRTLTEAATKDDNRQKQGTQPTRHTAVVKFGAAENQKRQEGSALSTSYLIDMEIEMHAHDDLGMATANTVAAVLAGATHINTTVNGLRATRPWKRP